MTKFEQTVRSMSIKEIILAMVEGLRNPTTEIDMESFGYLNLHKSLCYGCAATNAICKIGNISLSDLMDHFKNYNNISPTYINISSRIRLNRIKLINDKKQTKLGFYYFIAGFECVIDSLRHGDIKRCNVYLTRLQLPLMLTSDDITLPVLTDNYTSKELNQYVKFANLQS